MVTAIRRRSAGSFPICASVITVALPIAVVKTGQWNTYPADRQATSENRLSRPMYLACCIPNASVGPGTGIVHTGVNNVTQAIAAYAPRLKASVGAGIFAAQNLETIG